VSGESGKRSIREVRALGSRGIRTAITAYISPCVYFSFGKLELGSVSGLRWGRGDVNGIPVAKASEAQEKEYSHRNSKGKAR
jgi:hypothetical protein